MFPKEFAGISKGISQKSPNDGRSWVLQVWQCCESFHHRRSAAQLGRCLWPWAPSETGPRYSKSEIKVKVALVHYFFLGCDGTGAPPDSRACLSSPVQKMVDRTKIPSAQMHKDIKDPTCKEMSSSIKQVPSRGGLCIVLAIM